MAKRMVGKGITAVALWAAFGLSGSACAQSSARLPGAQPQAPVRVAPARVVALQATVPVDGETSWREFVALRQRLGLPAKERSVHRLPREQRRRVAMAELAKAHRVAQRWRQRAERASLDPGRWAAHVLQRDLAISGHFRAALRADPASLEALLALANTATDPVLARLAIETAGSRDIAAAVVAGGDSNAERVTERAVTLLMQLLENKEKALAEAAWQQLQWLLEAQPHSVPAMRDLLDRALAEWPKLAPLVACGPWDATRHTGIARRSVLAFPVPADLPSRLVVLASMLGDVEVLQRITTGGYDARIVLHCHALTAHRSDPDMARQLFGWYSRHPSRWRERLPHELNAWQWGVVTTLVGVLPQLDEDRLYYYEKHMRRGRVSSAARLVAVHRMLRLARHPGRSWLDLRWLDSDELDARGLGLLDLQPLHALWLWRYLASHQDWTLQGCVAALPAGTPDAARDRFLVEVLASAPVGERELRVLAGLWQKERPAVAAAVMRRTARSEPGRKKVRQWLRKMVAGSPEQQALAYQLAVELGVSLHIPAAVPLQPAGERPDAPALGRLRNLCRIASARAESPNKPFAERLAKPLREAIERWQAGDALLGERCALLAAAASHPHWWPQLGDFAARHTTHADPQVRHAAYRALAAPGASGLSVAALAREAVFDRSSLVRRDD